MFSLKKKKKKLLINISSGKVGTKNSPQITTNQIKIVGKSEFREVVGNNFN